MSESWPLINGGIMGISQNHSQNPAADIRKKERGFTLLEVIVAISILTVGLLAVASMQISAIRGNSFAISTTEATTWAANQVEKLIALPYNDYNLDDTNGDGADGLNDIGNDADRTEHQGRYTVCWNVAIDAVTNNTKTINVIVTWPHHKPVSIQHIKAR